MIDDAKWKVLLPFGKILYCYAYMINKCNYHFCEHCKYNFFSHLFNSWINAVFWYDGLKEKEEEQYDDNAWLLNIN